MAEKRIRRKEYLEELIRWREKQLIKVVSGVRRCGKSTLLALYMDYLRKNGVTGDQIVFINLEEAENEGLLNHKALYDHIKKKIRRGKYTYIFIDEVQRCAEFEKAVDSLFIRKKTDIYITGSNAYMLSGELATLLSGRYVEISMLPLSFSEYLAFTRLKDRREAFNRYITYGSFPYAAVLANDGGNEGLVKNYIEGIYNTILVKDAAKREGITDLAVLEDIVKFLADSIGSPVSAKRISNVLNSAGRKISVNTVEKYLRVLCECFIFYKTLRYDIKGKQHLKTQNKYYIVDTGIRNQLLASSSADLGHVLENIVYLELFRRGFKVNIGKVAEKEVDFVAARGGVLFYYQVSATVLDENTLRRELEPLEHIRDNHPKCLLTLDEYLPDANYSGILRMNVLDWLLKRRSRE